MPRTPTIHWFSGMRPNRYEDGLSLCHSCGNATREAEPNPALIARLEREPFGIHAKLSAGQYDALSMYARGWSYKAISTEFGRTDQAIIDRIAAGLTTLAKIDDVKVPEPVVHERETAPSRSTASTQTEDAAVLAFSIAGYIQARGYVETELLFNSEFADRLEAFISADPGGDPFGAIVAELVKEHGIKLDLSPEGFREGFSFDLDAA
jgi:hypothetical protein